MKERTASRTCWIWRSAWSACSKTQNCPNLLGVSSPGASVPLSRRFDHPEPSINPLGTSSSAFQPKSGNSVASPPLVASHLSERSMPVSLRRLVMTKAWVGLDSFLAATASLHLSRGESPSVLVLAFLPFLLAEKTLGRCSAARVLAYLAFGDFRGQLDHKSRLGCTPCLLDFVDAPRSTVPTMWILLLRLLDPLHRAALTNDCDGENLTLPGQQELQ